MKACIETVLYLSIYAYAYIMYICVYNFFLFSSFTHTKRNLRKVKKKRKKILKGRSKLN